MNKLKQITEFQQKVYAVVAKISRGKTMTYKQVAKAIGQPQAYRAVGNALNKNPALSKTRAGQVPIPCHRVIRSDGKIGGFAKGTKKKLQLLRDEGAL
ncbi:MAG: MGMT family protein [Parcubacteria group bacterium]|nr:MGMT family protein [Parcubacteria group bacterium]